MINQEFLNPRFLRYFISVADTGNILSASANLNVSQPSITRAIQIIEKNLEKQLFIRSKKGVKLTEDGEAFYFSAISIIAHNESVITNIKKSNLDIKKIEKQKELKIGLPNTFTFSHKKNILWLIKKNNPTHKIKIIEDDSYVLNNKIEKNLIDIAISCVPELSKNVLKTHIFFEPFCIAFYKGHHFSNLRAVNFEDIRKEPAYIFRNTCEFFYYLLKSQNKKTSQGDISKAIQERKEKGKNRDVIYTNSDATAASCINSGMGVAIVPESVAVDHKILFRPILKPSLGRDIFLIQNIHNKKELNILDQLIKSAIWS